MLAIGYGVTRNGLSYNFRKRTKNYRIKTKLALNYSPNHSNVAEQPLVAAKFYACKFFKTSDSDFVLFKFKPYIKNNYQRVVNNPQSLQ